MSWCFLKNKVLFMVSHLCGVPHLTVGPACCTTTSNIKRRKKEKKKARKAVCVPQLHNTRSHIHSRLHCIPSTLDLNCLTGRHLNRGCLFSVAVTPHLRLQEQNVFVVFSSHCSSRKLQPALEWAVNLRLAKERGTRTYYTGSKVWSQELIHC